MRYVHNFDTVSAFTESYSGEDYLEPWVSYTKENQKVDYNYVPKVTMQSYTLDEHYEEMILESRDFNGMTGTCENIWDILMVGWFRGSLGLSISVYDANGTHICGGGAKSFEIDSLDEVIGHECEAVDDILNHMSNAQPILFDTQTGEFNSILEGGIIKWSWTSWK